MTEASFDPAGPAIVAAPFAVLREADFADAGAPHSAR
jgi:hypothetical protein